MLDLDKIYNEHLEAAWQERYKDPAKTAEEWTRATVLDVLEAFLDRLHWERIDAENKHLEGSMP